MDRAWGPRDRECEGVKSGPDKFPVTKRKRGGVSTCRGRGLDKRKDETCNGLH